MNANMYTYVHTHINVRIRELYGPHISMDIGCAALGGGVGARGVQGDCGFVSNDNLGNYRVNFPRGARSHERLVRSKTVTTGVCGHEYSLVA